ncbi:NlpC/P60 family protein [Halobacillus alkaliphilus]|uniref:NlpC/P60 family protein n=1 Tax=Halobacillus alkaliphilus TaxID=396056 RepID=A0A1I2MXP0_9BACI|nr:C40 family peptidase [Halobacillus alkaliphilus]SFF96252.1 NlpC/P60 family protein [Halobacillus alkaliphilus]
MNVAVRKSRCWVYAAVIFSLVAAFVFTPFSKAEATINYGEEVSAVAERYAGSPFKWGGTTPKGFDASGFTQYIYSYSAAKKKIARTSADQYKQGKVVKKQSDLKFGDLVFFDTAGKGKVSFVGIYTGSGEFIAATSHGVRTQKLSSSYWKTKYVGAKSHF